MCVSPVSRCFSNLSAPFFVVGIAALSGARRPDLVMHRRLEVVVAAAANAM